MVEWDLHGTQLRKVSSSRFYDLKITPDGKKLVAVCTDKHFHVYDFNDWKNKRSYNFRCMLTCVQTSDDSKHAIVNTDAREVVLVDLDTGKVVQRYTGQIQDKWVIRGCFGGTDEHFVLSGSEG